MIFVSNNLKMCYKFLWEVFFKGFTIADKRSIIYEDFKLLLQKIVLQVFQKYWKLNLLKTSFDIK